MTKAKQEPELKPDLRVDGAKRINLAEQRRRRQAMAATPAPSREDTRVADAWRREERRAVHDADTAGLQSFSAKMVARTEPNSQRLR